MRARRMSIKRRIVNSLREIFVFVFFIGVIAIPVRVFLFQPFIVSGDSMLPTFSNGDYVIAEKLSYAFNEPERGDIVIFRHPEENTFIIKRVIGLPGESVEINTYGDIQVSGEAPLMKLTEEYLLNETTQGIPYAQDLGEREYLVLGDNRTKSSDSRVWGALPEKNIVGKVILRLLPVSNASTF